jgi:putative ABC transport system permease protein
MSGKFFWNLALQNIRRNRQSYLPYALSCMGTVMMFYIMFVLANTTALIGLYGGRTIQRTLALGVWVILLFALLFMFYTHSFLIKRRKKEFGLFNILGMEKKHIGSVLAIETALVGLVSTLTGMLVGAMLTKLMYLAVLRMLRVEGIPPLVIPESALPFSLLIFLVIHAFTLLNTLREIHLTSPMNLLKGENMGEREPKGRIGLALLGLICLGAGYGISITAQNDVRTSIPSFFLAVILVIIGTYALFIAGSVSMLKALRRNKAFYYHPRHFSVIAGMIHRMKRNAAGLATICILSTMVLVMMSSTLTIFLAGENLQEKALMGRDARVVAGPAGKEHIASYQVILKEEAQKAGIALENPITYRKATISNAVLDGGKIPLRIEMAGPLEEESVLVDVCLVSLEDYNALQKKSITLAPGEALSHSLYGSPLPERMILGEYPLTVRENLASIAPLEDYGHMMQSTYTLVMNQDDIARAITGMAGMPEEPQPWQWVCAFDTGDTASIEKIEDFFQQVRQRIRDTAADGYMFIATSHRASMRAEFRAVYGGLLFVAISLGLTFIMAMVLIIYYKQVSEGYEDKARFEIMQKVGMSDDEVRQSVKSQVLLVFFIPLVMAGIHLLAAYNIISKILVFSGLLVDRTGLLIVVSLATYVCFALFYVLVYVKTSNSYYKIVTA